MARLARLAHAGELHLVVHRGAQGRQVFFDDEDRAAYRDALTASAPAAEVAVHGYGLFDDEVRLLVTPAKTSALSALMQAIGRRYVRRFNLRHARRGTPWEGRFRSTIVDPALFIPCLRFAEGAERESASGAPPGSLAQHLGGKPDPVLIEHRAFWALGNTPFDREMAYRSTLGQPLPGDLVARIRDAAHKGWVLGSAAFVDSLAPGLGSRRPQPGRRGRPKKINMSPNNYEADTSLS